MGSGSVIIASGSDPSWVYYAAPSSTFSPRPTTPHFWNRRTQRTYEFDPQSRSFDAGGAWSPDGAWFVTRTSSPTHLEEGTALVMTRLDDTRPLEQYAVDVYLEPLEFDGAWLVWQP